MTREQISEYNFRISQSTITTYTITAIDLETFFISEAHKYVIDGLEDEARKSFRKALKVQQELMNILKVVDENSKNIMVLYMYINKALVAAANLYTVSDLDGLIKILENIKGFFTRLEKLDNGDLLMENSHVVYSGLTYGKGFLNESTDPLLSSNRGYKA